jgi:hypothetical protein
MKGQDLYDLEQNRWDYIDAIENLFNDLPDGSYTFTGQWWREYYYDDLGIWHWEDRSDIVYLKEESIKRLKWMNDHIDKVKKSIRYRGR